jgi:hypothetical protein
MSKLLLFIISIFIISCSNNNSKQEIIEQVDSLVVDTIDTIDCPAFMAQTPEEGLIEALIYYELDFPEIVYSQAILETGHFKSRICKEYNNLFGLYNSTTNDYYKFDNWWESVIGYKELVQKKYYRSEESYYYFLKNLPYAEDPKYINKIKKIKNEN